MRAEDFGAAIQGFAKDGLFFKKLARHAGMLRALAGQHEYDRRIFGSCFADDRAAGFFQCLNGFLRAAGDDDAAMRELAAAGLEREGDVG